MFINWPCLRNILTDGKKKKQKTFFNFSYEWQLKFLLLVKNTSATSATDEVFGGGTSHKIGGVCVNYV